MCASSIKTSICWSRLAPSSTPWSCSINACRRSGSARPSSFLAFFHDSLLPRQLASTTACFHDSLLPRQLASTTACFHDSLLPRQLASTTACFHDSLLPRQLASTTACFHDSLRRCRAARIVSRQHLRPKRSRTQPTRRRKVQRGAGSAPSTGGAAALRWAEQTASRSAAAIFAQRGDGRRCGERRERRGHVRSRRAPNPSRSEDGARCARPHAWRTSLV